MEKVNPSILDQIAIAKTEPGDDNNQDISSLVGKVDIRMLEHFAQDDADASLLGRAVQGEPGIMEFVEMFKAPIKVLHPLLTATQEGNYNGTEGLSALPFDGILLAHSNESEWQQFRNNKNNEAFLDRVYIVKVPYCLRVSEEVKIYEKLLVNSELTDAKCAPGTLNCWDSSPCCHASRSRKTRASTPRCGSMMARASKTRIPRRKAIRSIATTPAWTKG